MIERKATVIATQGEVLQVRIKTESTCGSCGHRSQCSPEKLIEVPRLHDAAPGDEITLGVEGGTLCASACVAYLLPAFTMLVGALSFEAAGTGASMLGALGGLLVGLVVGRLLAKHFLVGSVAPTIVPTAPGCAALPDRRPL